MQQPDYSISTPENVDLHLELAGIGNRLLAQLLDALVQLAVGLLVVIAALAAACIVFAMGLDSNAKNLAYSVIALVVILLLFFMQGAYFIILEGAWKGQTPGKKMAEIRVIEQNGQPIGWSASLFRNLLRYADNFLVVGMVVMLIDNKERRLGDLAAGTLVIRERKPDMTDSAIKINPRVANKPELAAMDVGLVSPVEYDLLADYLKRRKSLTKQSRPLVARQLSDHFQSKMQSPDLDRQDGKYEADEDYLEAIYSSYKARAAE
ncbi:MAG: RDD family protein [Candidatus Obscuribacter sp.]|nr:RDD family protein [Candidatus Obscuribacter sp.]